RPDRAGAARRHGRADRGRRLRRRGRALHHLRDGPWLAGRRRAARRPAAMSAAGDVVDRLYGLPLEEFTPQRDLAARELRRAGDREAAGGIAKLPKPTPAAWTANQVAREHPELIEGLLEAGESLRAAQAEALTGGGGRAL